MATILVRPAAGNVTGAYKVTHRALDFGHGNGTAVYAAAAGTISYEPSVGGYGKRLTIDHGKLIGTKAITRYAHLRSAVVTSGQVRQGQLIGYMGNTGWFAVFVHLHFELLVNFGAGLAKVNPTQYFTAPAGGGNVIPLPTPTNPKEKNVTIYYRTSDDKPSHAGNTIEMYALAGESPGTSANFLETARADIKAGWSTAHGAGVHLTTVVYNGYKARYLEPLKTVGGSAGYVGPTAAEIAKAVNDVTAQRLSN